MAGAARLLIHPIRDVLIVNFQDTSILDTALVEKIAEELYDLVDNKARRKLVLDFSKVQFLSSSALGVLITLRKKMTAMKGQLVICSMRKELMRVFEIASLTKLFTFRPDEREALTFFGITSGG
jgi:anti-sigma B factor antagonist